MGGGRRAFKSSADGGNRIDGRNLVQEYLLRESLSNRRPVYVSDRVRIFYKKNCSLNNSINIFKDELLRVDSTTTDSLLGLFSQNHMEYKLLSDGLNEPTLLEMTSKALEILKKNERGYVLLVEGIFEVLM